MDNNKLIKFKNVVEEMIEEGFHIGYISLLAFYKDNKLSKESNDMIIEKKKISNVSYFIKESDKEKFKETLRQQFN